MFSTQTNSWIIWENLELHVLLSSCFRDLDCEPLVKKHLSHLEVEKEEQRRPQGRQDSERQHEAGRKQSQTQTAGLLKEGVTGDDSPGHIDLEIKKRSWFHSIGFYHIYLHFHFKKKLISEFKRREHIILPCVKRK